MHNYVGSFSDVSDTIAMYVVPHCTNYGITKNNLETCMASMFHDTLEVFIEDSIMLYASYNEGIS